MVTIQCGDLDIALQEDGLDGQRLLIPVTSQGERLAELLLDGLPEREGDRFIVPHSADVDQRILNLIDMLTTVRWAHPSLTQLTLDL
jgi:hypothetical protein